MLGPSSVFLFRYINLLSPSLGANQLPLLNLHVELVGRSPNERGFLLRTEFDSVDITSVVQIVPNASAKGPNDVEVSGLLVDIDTILEKLPESTFFAEPTPDLEKTHRAVKETFFSLLTEKKR